MKVALDPSDPSFATRSAVIHFDKSLVFNSAKFPSCTEAQVRSGAAACDKAKVGSGKAAGLAVGQQRGPGRHRLQRPAGQEHAAARHGQQPLRIDSIIVGKLAADSGAFGRKLVVAIPANLQQPLGGVFATLTSFVTKVGGSAKGTPYVALKGCSGGKLQVQGRLRLHRRLQAVAHLDVRLQEVGAVQRLPKGRERAPGSLAARRSA